MDFQKMLIGETDKDTGMFTRATRRLIAFMGMLNFAIISILCTSSLTQPSSPSPHQKTKNQPKSSGDSLPSQVEQKLHLQSLLDTSLLSQSPLWEQSSDSISHQEDEKDRY